MGSTDAGQSLRSEQAAILGVYAAMIEATRRSVPAREVAAAIRALLDAQKAAMRAVVERRQVVRAAAREMRQGAHGAATDGVRQARGPPPL